MHKQHAMFFLKMGSTEAPARRQWAWSCAGRRSDTRDPQRSVPWRASRAARPWRLVSAWSSSCCRSSWRGRGSRPSSSRDPSRYRAPGRMEQFAVVFCQNDGCWLQIPILKGGSSQLCSTWGPGEEFHKSCSSSRSPSWTVPQKTNSFRIDQRCTKCVGWSSNRFIRTPGRIDQHCRSEEADAEQVVHLFFQVANSTHPKTQRCSYGVPPELIITINMYVGKMMVDHRAPYRCWRVQWSMQSLKLKKSPETWQNTHLSQPKEHILDDNFCLQNMSILTNRTTFDSPRAVPGTRTTKAAKMQKLCTKGSGDVAPMAKEPQVVKVVTNLGMAWAAAHRSFGTAPVGRVI